MTELVSTVVRIWRGIPGKDAEFLGTGVIIAPGMVLTARHVIETPSGDSIPAAEINVTSDFGAFERGGPQGIRDPTLPPDPDLDLALLPLMRPSREDVFALIHPDGPALVDNPKVELYGYADLGKGVGPKQAHIPTYAGAYHRYVLDVPAQAGNSGGPVFWRGHLIGIVTTDLERETLAQPLDGPAIEFINRHLSLDQIYRRIPISEWHVRELMALLTSLQEPVPPDVIAELYPRVAGELVSEPEAGQDPFEQSLTRLARRRNGPSKAPFLVFLSACHRRAGLDHQLPPELGEALMLWQEEARERIGMTHETLALQVHNCLEPPSDDRPAVLVAKVEPNLLEPPDTWYHLEAWLGYHGASDNGDEHLDFEPLQLPSMPDDDHHDPGKGIDRDALVKRVCAAVQIGYLKLRGERRAKTLRVELVLPHWLFDWNPKGVEIRPKETLPASYPLVLRSWERNYPWWENPLSEEGNPDNWEKKCTKLPDHTLKKHNVWREESAKEGEDLRETLKGDKVLALIAPCPAGEHRERAQEILKAGLIGGLPFMFWPLISTLEGRDKHEALLRWVQAARHQDWPELMHWVRCEEHPDWLDLALLWDNPRYPTPGRNCSNDLTD